MTNINPEDYKPYESHEEFMKDVRKAIELCNERKANEQKRRESEKSEE